MDRETFWLIERTLTREFGVGIVTRARDRRPPPHADMFALSLAEVIFDSPLRAKGSSLNVSRLRALLLASRSAREVHTHAPRAAAVDRIWASRHVYLRLYRSAPDKRGYLGSLPWIGPKGALAACRNFGLDLVVPSARMTRLGAHFKTSHLTVCRVLARETCYSTGGIDLILQSAIDAQILHPDTGVVTIPSSQNTYDIQMAYGDHRMRIEIDNPLTYHN